VHVDPGTARTIVNRLRRVAGQIQGVAAMVEDDRNCDEIITQLAAASKALDRAGFQLLSAQVRQCLTAPPGQESQQLGLARLEKLFLSLS